MVLGFLDDPTRAVMRSAMDACALRNTVIADNIANADTPGFKRSVVRFEDTLRELLVAGGPETMEDTRNLASRVEVDQSGSSRLDGNNVNIDAEMSDLAKNSIEYNALIELNRLKGRMLSTVVSGGAR